MSDRNFHSIQMIEAVFRQYSLVSTNDDENNNNSTTRAQLKSVLCQEQSIRNLSIF
jgi:hypothetical protein